MNQIELHPRFQQAELRAWHADHDVVTEAWSPLAQGDLLEDGTIETIAAHHDRTPAQVILRWHLQVGNVVIPKSATPERIRENFEVFDFELSEDDMAAIERLETRRADRAGSGDFQRWVRWLRGRGGYPFQTHLAYGSTLSVWRRYPAPSW